MTTVCELFIQNANRYLLRNEREELYDDENITRSSLWESFNDFDGVKNNAKWIFMYDNVFTPVPPK